jgi:hypothetical protein
MAQRGRRHPPAPRDRGRRWPAGHLEVRRGSNITAVEAQDGSVAVVARRIDDSHEETIETGWVIGCDGAGSAVRAAMQLPFTDLGYAFDWLVVDVVTADGRRWRPLNVQVCDPARPTTAVSGGPGRRRFEFMRLPTDAPATFERAETAWQLLAPWGYTPANASLRRHATYRFGAGLVERWRRGRVLLAGDAAHQMPPFAGQGLCSGLRDAANLVWKLDLVLARMASEQLLDTYGGERAPQVRAEINFSVDLGRIISMLDPIEAAGRDEAMIAAALASGPIDIPPGPPLGPGATLAGDPNAGHLSLQAQVEAGGRRGLGDDVVGGGWTLIGSGSDPATTLEAPLVTWWQSVGGRSWQVGPGGPVDDVDGRYAEWMRGLGATVVLVRPDFYVFGTATEPTGGTHLISALRAAIEAR